MTLIVGIRCSDGIVVATDAGAVPGTGIVEVTEGVQKIYPIDDRFLVALGGYSGQGLRFLETIRRLDLPDTTAFRCFDIQERIHAGMQPLFESIAVAARRAREIFGNEGLSYVLAEALIAYLGSDGPCLLHVNHLGQCDRIEETLYHVIGDGEKVAAPFLSYIKKHVWQHRQPTIATGIVCALWMFHFAHNCSGDFAPPWTVATLERLPDGHARIELLTEDILDPHHSYVDAIEKEFGKLPEAVDNTSGDTKPPTVAQAIENARSTVELGANEAT